MRLADVFLILLNRLIIEPMLGLNYKGLGKSSNNTQYIRRSLQSLLSRKYTVLERSAKVCIWCFLMLDNTSSGSKHQLLLSTQRIWFYTYTFCHVWFNNPHAYVYNSLTAPWKFTNKISLFYIMSSSPSSSSAISLANSKSCCSRSRRSYNQKVAPYECMYNWR